MENFNFKQILYSSIDEILNDENFHKTKVITLGSSEEIIEKKPLSGTLLSRIKPISKIYEVQWDCMGLVIILEEGEDLFEVIKKDDEYFIKKGNEIFYDFGNGTQVEVNISDVTNYKGIIARSCVG